MPSTNISHQIPQREIALADQLEAAQARIEDLEGETKDRGCPVHVGSIHGREAEELRAGIERLIESDCDDLEGMRERMQRLLDRVDARDSLAHLERGNIIAEVERMRPVIEAAEQYRDNGPVGAGIIAAVDVYRAARDRP